VLMRGLASNRGQILRCGDHWGEDFILGHRPLRRLNVVSALTFIEVQDLSRNHFNDIMESCASSADYGVIRRAVVKLAFIRGMVAAAKQVQADRLHRQMGDQPAHHDVHISDMVSMSSQMLHRPTIVLEEDEIKHERGPCTAPLCAGVAGSTATVRAGSDGCSAPAAMTNEFKQELRNIIREELRGVNPPSQRQTHNPAAGGREDLPLQGLDRGTSISGMFRPGKIRHTQVCDASLSVGSGNFRPRVNSLTE